MRFTLPSAFALSSAGLPAAADGRNWLHVGVEKAAEVVVLGSAGVGAGLVTADPSPSQSWLVFVHVTLLTSWLVEEKSSSPNTGEGGGREVGGRRRKAMPRARIEGRQQPTRGASRLASGTAKTSSWFGRSGAHQVNGRRPRHIRVVNGLLRTEPGAFDHGRVEQRHVAPNSLALLQIEQGVVV